MVKLMVEKFGTTHGIASELPNAQKAMFELQGFGVYPFYLESLPSNN